MNPEAKEWLVEYWEPLFAGRGWTVASQPGPRFEHFYPVKPMSFEKAASLAKRRHTASVANLQYRVRNVRTGDILPAAIL